MTKVFGNITRKNSIFLILFLFVWAFLPACNAQIESTFVPSSTSTSQFTQSAPLPSPTQTEDIVRGTIRIWHSLDETQIPALVQIQTGFKEIYPDVNYDFLYIPSADLKPRYEMETHQGTGPSILMGPAEWGPELYTADAIADMRGKVDDVLLNNLNQPALGASEFKGALIGLPYAIQGVVLYRNKDIITITPNTFDDLVALAQASTLGDDIGAILERSFFYSGAHLNGIGGELMDSDGLPAFNDERGLIWLQLLQEFEEAGPTNYYTDEDLERFMSGNIGWIIDGTWNLESLAESIGPEKLAIDPWPSYQDGRLSGYVRAENLYLNPKLNPDDLRANLKFIEYMLSPEAGVSLAEAGFIPAASGTQWDDPSRGPLIEQAITALSSGITYPTAPEMEIYNVNMDIALQSFFESGLSAAEVLQTAHNAITAEIEESKVTPTAIP